MIKYLIMLFTLTTLFSVQEPILPSEADLKIVRTITGHKLNNIKFDNSFEKPRLSPYKFDGGKVAFHACKELPYQYEKPSDKITVTQRFFARAETRTETEADKKDTKIIGLNVSLVSSGETFRLTVYSKSCIQWSKLSKSAIYALLEVPQMDQWYITAPEPAVLPPEVQEFLNIEFRVQF